MGMHEEEEVEEPICFQSTLESCSCEIFNVYGLTLTLYCKKSLDIFDASQIEENEGGGR